MVLARLPAMLLLLCASAAGAAPVDLVAVQGPIGPASADYVHRGLEHAARTGAQLVVLRLDTPGGLDSAMRGIVQDILASPVPVAAYVAPGGARAASAGTFILYAAQIAAMAPGTNLGAASPIALGGGEEKGTDQSTPIKKATNDAAAYIRGLAQLRGRNADWGERAVREAVSLPAAEALKLKVIDLVADDLPQLLEKLDGRAVELHGNKVVLRTKGENPTTFEADWRTRFLGVVTNPTIAYGLLILGLYAIAFEFMNPGLVLPGVAGAVSVLIALYALHMLPVSYAGLALILLGLGFMAAEVFFPAYGSLGIGGAVAFVFGSVMLIDTDIPGFGVPLPLIVGVAAASAAFIVGVAGLALRTRRRPIVSGRETLVGAAGEVLESFEAEGWARVRGETWRVRSRLPRKAGERVKVAGVDGLVLEVETPDKPISGA